jgi:hypothetical protein
VGLGASTSSTSAPGAVASPRPDGHDLVTWTEAPAPPADPSYAPTDGLRDSSRPGPRCRAYAVRGRPSSGAGGDARSGRWGAPVQRPILCDKRGAEGRCVARLAPQGERSRGTCQPRDRVAREAPDSLAASAPLLGRDSPWSLGPGVVPLVLWWITDGSGPPELQGDAPRTGLPRRDQLKAAWEGCRGWISGIKPRVQGVKRPPTGGLFL